MIVNKQRLAPLHCASTDSNRYNLNAIRFDADGSVVATNGHILARVVPCDAERRSDVESFSLELEAAKDLSRSVTKKGSVAVLDVEATNANGHVEFNGGDRRFPKQGLEYPPWQQVHKQPQSADVALEIGLGLPVLEQLVKTLRQFSGPGDKSGAKGVRLRFKADPKQPDRADPLQAVFVEAFDPESGDTLELSVMPMRL